MDPRAGLDRCGKFRPPPGFDPRIVQPVASRYTDYATRPTSLRRNDVKFPFCGRVQIVCFRIVVYSLVTFGVKLVLVQERSGIYLPGIPKSGKTKLVNLISTEKEL